MAEEKRRLSLASDKALSNEEVLGEIMAVVHRLAQFMNEQKIPKHIGGSALLLLAADVAGTRSPLGKALAENISQYLHISIEEPTKQ